MISRKRTDVLALVAAAVLGWPPPGYAQAAPDPGLDQPSPPAKLEAGFQDDFFIETADVNTRLNIGMVAQADARVFIDQRQPNVDTFLIRKARPTFTGRI